MRVNYSLIVVIHSMADYSSREEMLEAFGPFSVVFQPMDQVRSPYLCLLHLHGPRTPRVVAAIREATTESVADGFVVTLLRDVNWRPHLVAAIAAYYRPKENVVMQMWTALDAGSWVTPQLAATLSTIDHHFRERAIERLRACCPLSQDPEYSLEDPVKRHSAQGPAGSLHRSAKAAAALDALLTLDFNDDEQIESLKGLDPLQQLISSDFDNSGAIAESWRSKFLSLVE